MMARPSYDQARRPRENQQERRPRSSRPHLRVDDKRGAQRRLERSVIRRCNAKAMARTLRRAFAAKGLKITTSRSLELIAEMFGVADWNTLAAKVRAGEKSMSREKISTPSLAAVASNSVPPVSATLAATLHRALFFATQRKHEYARHWSIFCSP